MCFTFSSCTFLSCFVCFLCPLLRRPHRSPGLAPESVAASELRGALGVRLASGLRVGEEDMFCVAKGFTECMFGVFFAIFCVSKGVLLSPRGVFVLQRVFQRVGI